MFPNLDNFLFKSVLFLFFIFSALLPLAVSATPDTPVDNYFRAQVAEIIDSGVNDWDGQLQSWQSLDLEILNGSEKGRHITVNNGKDFVAGVYQTYAVGDKVVVMVSAAPADAPFHNYYIVDRYRNPGLLAIALIFLALAIYFGRWRGFTALIGLALGVLVIFYFIIPRILNGADPFLTCVAGSVVIVLASLYTAHGFNRRTSVALVSTLLALALAVAVDWLFVHIAQLSGNGTEEAFYLQLDTFTINLRGLLMGGIIIGVLGVLDDVTTGQAAAVEEIHEANRALGFAQLYRKGLSVGREHIASLINTLVLAYVGASFPLLLLYNFQKTQSFWLTLNSNFIAEEITRTLVGSTVLVVAVPLTTFLAAFWYSRDAKSS